MTARELQIWTLMSQGKSNSEISLALSIGEKTVKTHNTAIFRTLRVKNRTQATIAFLNRKTPCGVLVSQHSSECPFCNRQPSSQEKQND